MGQIHVRVLTTADLPSLSEGDLIYVSGIYLSDDEVQPATIKAVNRKPIYASGNNSPQRRRAAASGEEPVGYQYKVEYRTLYGSQSEFSRYDSEETLLARFPDSNTSAAAASNAYDRDHYTTKVAENPVYLADPDGDQMTLIDTYGCRVTTSVILPGVTDPDEAAARIEAAILAACPDGKMPKLQAQPVADIRVDVYDFVDENLIAVNVLHAEAGYFHADNRTSIVTRRVPPGRPTGTP